MASVFSTACGKTGATQRPGADATRPETTLERVDAVARGGPPPHDRAERFDQPSTPRGHMRQRRIVAVHADQAVTHERGHTDGVHEVHAW
jgi:hypothetical protein